MAHELDITNGVASFANSRSDAWHRLGTSVGHAMTGQEAMEAAQRRPRNPEKSGVHDGVLQRALDLVTSIGIFQKK